MMRRRIACPLDHAHRQLLRISGAILAPPCVEQCNLIQRRPAGGKERIRKIENVLQFAIGDDEAQFESISETPPGMCSMMVRI